MKFPLSPGAWLLATATIYLIVSMTNLFLYKFTATEYIQTVWLCVTALPLFVPAKKLVSIDPIWRM
jgi:TRAP-type mannitol/chloroaromatic compound transport system permease large subunit